MLKLRSYQHYDNRTYLIILLLVLNLACFGVGHANAKTQQINNYDQLPNFAKLHPKPVRRRAFFQYLTPIVIRQDKLILAKRKHLFALYYSWLGGTKLTRDQRRWLIALAKDYKLSQVDSKQDWQRLLMRVDIIPVSLALAQAEKETASGTTRFAREGLNLYGMWCHRPGCGIVPLQRPKGASYEVTKYPTVTASVAAYMHNLNTNRHYKVFRELRAQQRRLTGKLDGFMLASTLLSYSSLREVYLRDIQTIISNNNLATREINMRHYE